MILVEFIIIGLCSFLWWKGGIKNGSIRDIPIPIICAAYLAFKFKTWWLFILIGGAMQMIRLGYGNYDPENDDKPSLLAKLTKDREGSIIRALWGLICGVWIGLFLYILHFIPLFNWLLYIALNIAINFISNKFTFTQKLQDHLIGGTIALVVLL